MVHRLVTWAAADYRAYAIVAFLAKAAATPYYLFLHFDSVRRYRLIFREARKKDRKVVIVSLGHAVTFQFVKKLCALLSEDSRIELVFSSGSPALTPEKIQELTGADFVLPYGILPVLRAHAYITPKSTTFWHVPRRTPLMHVFHSPVSIHQVYSEGSFQGFDVFLANGPHQVKELQMYLPKRGMRGYRIFETGSEIIDQYVASAIPSDKIQQVIFAPSWGEVSSLRLMGRNIVSELLDAGLTVVFRPHPASLTHDKSFVDEIVTIFGQHPRFVFDDVSRGGIIDPLMDAMVSDWSGVALEFAVGYRKPVFFMDTPQKIMNVRWSSYLPQPGIEFTYRDKIGFLVSDAAALKNEISRVNADYTYFSAKAGRHYGDLIFNPGNSAQAACLAVRETLGLTAP
jgi:hypothetical protein